MHFDDKPVCLSVSFLDKDLTTKQRSDFASFLSSRKSIHMAQWFASIIPRLYGDAITQEWVESQDFARDLRNNCGIKIVMITNFPCDTDIIPKNNYPLAFVITGV